MGVKTHTSRLYGKFRFELFGHFLIEVFLRFKIAIKLGAAELSVNIPLNEFSFAFDTLILTRLPAWK